jgi:hypothetical protein
MFERFRDSIVYPKRIIQFRKDHMIRVIGYILLFALLMTSASIVALVRFESIPTVFRDAFKEDIVVVDIPCVTNDTSLVCEEEVTEYFYDDGFFLMGVTTQEPDIEETPLLEYRIVFYDDQVIMHYAGIEYGVLIEDLPSSFHNFDFTLLSSDTDGFGEALLDGIGDYLVSLKAILAPIVIVSSVVSNVFMILFVAFMNAIILKMRFRVIPFKEVFKMGTYLGTLLYILLIVNSFFGLGIFMIILFLVLTFRQTNALSMEIFRVIKK